MARFSVHVTRYEFDLRKRRQTAMIVSAEENEHVNSPKALFEQLKKAVTAWFCLGGSKAIAAWLYSGDDFNLGDLCGYLEDASLQELLEEHHLIGFSVSDLPDELGDWNYDTTLMDASEVEKSMWVKNINAGGTL